MNTKKLKKTYRKKKAFDMLQIHYYIGFNVRTCRKGENQSCLSEINDDREREAWNRMVFFC